MFVKGFQLFWKDQYKISHSDRLWGQSAEEDFSIKAFSYLCFLFLFF